MNILLASSIDAAAIAALEERYDVVRAFGASEDVLQDAVADRDVLVFRSGVTISSRVMDAGSRLKLLLRAGAGLDNVDVAHARSQGLRLVRVPGSSAQPVAELTFALLLDVARKVSLADRLVRQGRWPKSELLGRLVTGKTLGVVGAGNIGSTVARLGAAWGMDVLAVVKHPTPEREAAFRADGITLTDFETALAESDFVTLHVPLDPTTRHLIDADALSRTKPGAYLVNIARGGVVDEQALLQELSDGRLAGAALDVHEREGEGTHSPLAELPNVVLTPHIGAMAADSQEQIGRRILELVDAFAAGGIDEVTHDGELVV